MDKDSDPVTVTLSRAEAQAVKRVLFVGMPTERHPEAVRAALLKVERALEPVPAPDPATFVVKVPDPKRTKPWPEMKSAQEISADDA